MDPYGPTRLFVPPEARLAILSTRLRDNFHEQQEAGNRALANEAVRRAEEILWRGADQLHRAYCARMTATGGLSSRTGRQGTWGSNLCGNYFLSF